MKQAEALEILKTGINVFLTGEPGSGKTHTINQYVSYLRSHDIEVAVTASTGIAATHLGGMTIHSWSGIGIKSGLSASDVRTIAARPNQKKRISKTKVLVIDEISMLAPETLQSVDQVCRQVKRDNSPFGGMQVVFVGDFFQLPPVVRNPINNFENSLFAETPARFAYEADCWKQAEVTVCYLTEQYRQDDDELLSLLSKIRQNAFDDIALSSLTSRLSDPATVPDFVPKLFSHNLDVDAVNLRMLQKLPGRPTVFQMKAQGPEKLIEAMKKGCLSPEDLHLKVGAAVMFTKNNPKEGYANGTLGVVVDFDKETGLPIVKTRSGRTVTVDRADWSIEDDGLIKGVLTQIPLRLAWAITVHKSQGVSLDEAVIDLSKVFEYGQGYVAISRVRRLAGIYLLGWNEKALQVDPLVFAADQAFRLESESARRIYSKMPESMLRSLQYDFVIKAEGKLEISDPAARKIKAKQLPTQEETLKYWQEGKNLVEIAKVRKLSEQTVFDHIEKLVKTGKISPAELSRLIDPAFKSDISAIKAAFHKLGKDKLTPIFEYFKGKYSFELLKVVRLMK